MIILKRKSLAVVFLSTTLIGLVILITVVGVYFYNSWCFEQDNLRYREALSRLNAELFSENILIKNSHIASIMTKNEMLPAIKGQIVNRSKKNIKDIRIKAMFVDPNDKVVYVSIFSPIIQKNGFLDLDGGTTVIFAPEDSISFEHKLFNIPFDLRDTLIDESNFSKDKQKDLKLEFEILGVVLA